MCLVDMVNVNYYTIIMGKYWYRDDDGKWRMGDDNDDLAVGIILLILMGLFWFVRKPVQWWVLKSEEPTTGGMVLWGVVTIAIVVIILWMSSVS